MTKCIAPHLSHLLPTSPPRVPLRPCLSPSGRWQFVAPKSQPRRPRGPLQDPHPRAPSTCPVHAGAVVYSSAVLHADAVVYTGAVVCTGAAVHASIV
eukprot:4818802-Pyramimonas_sp.AAC.1